MLLMELLSKEELNDDIILVKKIKNLTINLKSARQIDEPFQQEAVLRFQS